jgi:hypothetical protein
LVPLVPIGGIVCCLFLMIGLPLDTWARFVVWLVIGLAISCGYGRSHSTLAAASGCAELRAASLSIGVLTGTADSGPGSVHRSGSARAFRQMDDGSPSRGLKDVRRQISHSDETLAAVSLSKVRIGDAGRAVVMHDADNDDMPDRGWLLYMNNLVRMRNGTGHRQVVRATDFFWCPTRHVNSPVQTP